ncbi:MAG: hypothetical protein F2754_13155 [Actinobacteria bacterium]|uniref:Unannotated protein n=1 Tax=freshwater metagenome TaxID=449393 RepID=A0A6J6UCZ9_9ZZZZ|nr:hypothetical protein [Actinomycetota bacterium]MSW92077.1 hypothetical protein [Actinomycetota bacterium]MSX88324.1 hypothetical protein [Actinomycetota bacterium]MSY72496.1 hypothetical protein [Actinomycetota bacterium]
MDLLGTDRRDTIGPEEVTLRGRELYLFLPNAQGRGLQTVATPSLPQLVVQKRGWPRF